MNSSRLAISALRNGQRTVIFHYPSTKIDYGTSTALDDDGNNPGPSLLNPLGRGAGDGLCLLSPFFNPLLPHFSISGLHLQQNLSTHDVVEELARKLAKVEEPKRKMGFILPRGKPTTREESVQTCSELTPTPEEDARRRLESFPRDMENQVGAELLAAGYEKEAFERFRAAAKKGSLSAVHNLGLCYFEGHGTTKSAEKAFKMWDYGANFSDADCTYQLAVCYLRGLGTVKDTTKGQRYMNMAALQGSPEALYYRAMQQVRLKQLDDLPRTLKELLKNEKQRNRVSGWLTKKGFPEEARHLVQEAMAPYQTPF